MLRSFKALSLSRAASCASITCQLIVFAATLACAQSAAPDSSPSSTYPSAGTTISASNLPAYQQFLPTAAQLAVSRGFTIKIIPTERFDWPGGFTAATEKYSAQVGLDKTDAITNYIAGMPFPIFNVNDPKAAIKIAYNWHMGPFMPDDFELAPWGSYAYSSTGAPNSFVPEDPTTTFARTSISCVSPIELKSSRVPRWVQIPTMSSGRRDATTGPATPTATRARAASGSDISIQKRWTIFTTSTESSAGAWNPMTR